MNSSQPKRPCAVEDCSRVHYGKGYCKLHYSRWKRNGTPEKLEHPFADVGPSKDITGQKFGMLSVESYAAVSEWNCICDCGGRTVVRGAFLKSSKVRSCGCLLRTADGASGDPEYKIWAQMNYRCENEANISYPMYGGRGITVEYENYEQFLKDVGRRPSVEYSIDRIDNNGNYAPGNCRWATRTEQANNTSRNVRVSYKGKDMTVAELSRKTGIAYGTLQRRITHNKLSGDDAVSIPNMRGKSFG